MQNCMKMSLVAVAFISTALCVSCAKSSLGEAQEITRRTPRTQLVGSVLYDESDQSFKFTEEAVAGKKAPATGSYIDGADLPSNFGQLRITTDPEFDDLIQMSAAGYLEGYLTAERIFDFNYNARYALEASTNQVFPIGNWLMKQVRWLKQQAESPVTRASGDPWWGSVRLLLAQLDGLANGYNSRVGELAEEGAGYSYLSMWDLIILQNYGDAMDLAKMLKRQEGGQNQGQGGAPDLPDWSSFTPAELRRYLGTRGHCSVLVKVTPDFSDLLVGHVTWWSYHSMLRVYKHYDFKLQDPAIRAQKISFSSYPGIISSLDDWYILGSSMIVTETTNSMIDASVLDGVKPESAPSWIRVRAAHMLAQNGSHWASLVARENSGTYNNQYMVVDLNRFTPGMELQPGLLTIVELIPNLSVTADTTQELERGYWPSYNIPYFKEIYEGAGYTAAVNHSLLLRPELREVMAGLKYQLAPRAKILRRDSGSVNDLSSLKLLMRSNAWVSDPYSSSPWDAVCSRGDLEVDAPHASGCTDGKVTSYSLAKAMTAEAINGPTHNVFLKPFAWSTSPFADTPHRGIPDVLSSTWEVQAP